jgi:hypothetical protein
MESLTKRIKETIAIAGSRMQEYTNASKKFVVDIGASTTELENLIKQLRACLEILKGLLLTYEKLIGRINDLELKIQELESTATEDAKKTVNAGCMDTLRGLLELIKALSTDIEQFKGDSKAIESQITSLDSTIKEICREADNLLKQQGRADISVSKLEQKLNRESGETKTDTEGNVVRNAVRNTENTIPSLVMPQLRGGWQTPERLRSLSKTKPLRTYSDIKKKKKTKKSKKSKKTTTKKKRNKRKRKKKKRTAKRRKGGRKGNRRS